MRIVTFNIHGWRTRKKRSNLALVGDLLEQLDADIIGLNEVDHPCSPQGSDLAALAERLDMFYAFGACKSFKFPKEDAHFFFGNAILSRLPVKAVSSGLFSDVPEKQQRGYVEAQIDSGNGEALSVVVTHLDHTDEAARMAQLEDLLSGCEPSKWDVVLGDFNCIHPLDYEDRPSTLERLSHHPLGGHLANAPVGPMVTARMEAQGYADAMLEKGQRGEGTFIPAEEPVRLDYIWISSQWLPRLTAAEVVEEPMGQEASDHRAVMIELGGGGA